MRFSSNAAGLFLIAWVLHAGDAAAAVLRYSSQAEFLAKSGYSESAAAVVRQGDGDQGGPFEYALLKEGGVPVIDSLGDVTWSDHETHDPGLTVLETGLARLTLRDGEGLFGDTGLRDIGANPAINALVVQLNAENADSASLGNITVVLEAGEQIGLGPILDEAGDGEFLMLVDTRLGKGFSLSAAAVLIDAGDALDDATVPGYRFSLGATTVPLPAAGWLLGAALGLLGWLRRSTGS